MSQTPDKNTPVTASDDAQNIAADVKRNPVIDIPHTQ